MSGFDINYLRAAVTLLSFVSFVAIIFWALARRNQASFDEAAQLPFIGDTAPSHTESSRHAEPRE